MSAVDALIAYHEELVRFVKAAEVLAKHYSVRMPVLPSHNLDLSNPSSIYDQAAHISFLADWTEVLIKAVIPPPAPPVVDGSQLPPITGVLRLDLSDVRTN